MLKPFTFLVALAMLLSWTTSPAVAWQTDEVEAQEKAGTGGAAKKKAATKKNAADEKATPDADQDEQGVISTADNKAPAPVIPDRFLRIQMWDGTVVSGIVNTPAIDVETEFGSLRIPIQRIVTFRPGTDSNPDLKKEVESLIDQLGDREFRTRETAHRRLVSMGPMIASLIRQYDDGGDAERKKHLTDIRKEIDALVEEAEEEGEQTDNSLLKGDQIETPDFAIVGKIQQAQFQVESKIGELRIQLADIRKADRGDTPQSGAIRKRINVDGNAFFQKTPTKTKIRVSKGDTITISATGVVQWTNWSQTATPEGLPNQGNWNGHANGSLIARVGEDGDFEFIGSDAKFTARKSGMLYLGVAMSDNYANNAGYRWVGKFKTKIKIDPGQ